MTLFEDCKVSKDSDGIWHGVSLNGIMSVVPNKPSKFPDDKHIFLRNFIKFPTGEGAEKTERRVRVLIGRLDDVRVYLVKSDPPQIVITNQDLYF